MESFFVIKFKYLIGNGIISSNQQFVHLTHSYFVFIMLLLILFALCFANAELPALPIGNPLRSPYTPKVHTSISHYQNKVILYISNGQLDKASMYFHIHPSAT